MTTLQSCTMTTRSFTTVHRMAKNHKPKLKCEDNAEFIEILAKKREDSLNSNKFNNSHYQTNLSRAMKSIAALKDPLTCRQEALAVTGIGNHIAKLLFPNEIAVPKHAYRPPSPSNSVSSDVSRTRAIRETNKRRKIIDKPSHKQNAYDRAVERAKDYLEKDYIWKVVLLVDQRERKSDHMIAKVQMSGIPSEERVLPIGDMLWVAQGRLPDAADPSVEVCLGTVIERKTVEDLVASKFGTRYNEQQLRLRDSGLSQVLFLIEGDLNMALAGCTPETVHTCMWEIRLHRNFQIVHTKHMDDTVLTLKRLHRHVLRRAFPHAFGREELPAFAGNMARGARRNAKSLIGMEFESTPACPEGTDRLITYRELKAKIELDREQGTRTVGNVHASMLNQVKTISSAKIQALLDAYPTPHSLFLAFQECESNEKRKNLLAGINLSGNTARVSRLGTKSANEMYIAYGMDPGGDDVLGPSHYEAMVSKVRDEQEKAAPSQSQTSKEVESPDDLLNDPWFRGEESPKRPLEAISEAVEEVDSPLSDRKPAARTSTPPSVPRQLDPRRERDFVDLLSSAESSTKLPFMNENTAPKVARVLPMARPEKPTWLDTSSDEDDDLAVFGKKKVPEVVEISD